MTAGNYSIGFNLDDGYLMRATVRLREANAETPLPTYERVDHAPRAGFITPQIQPVSSAPDQSYAAVFAEELMSAGQSATASGLKSGTHIRTTRGVAAVDYLTAGDEVVTASGSTRRVERVERRLVAFDVQGSLTIRIARGALGDLKPSKDLWLAPQQMLTVGAVKILAAELVNGVSVEQVRIIDPVICFDIVLDQPDILLAEDAPVGSFSSAGPHLSGAPERDTARRQVATRAGVEDTPPPRTARLRGFLEDCSPTRIAGWAQDRQNEAKPVHIAILLDGAVLAEIKADQWRKDLQAAQIGDGFHAFEYRPASPLPSAKLDSVKIVCVVDGTELKPVASLTAGRGL